MLLTYLHFYDVFVFTNLKKGVKVLSRKYAANLLEAEKTRTRTYWRKQITINYKHAEKQNTTKLKYIKNCY